MAIGIDSCAKAEVGNYIVLAEWQTDESGDWHIVNVKSAKVDGKKDKSKYTLQIGKWGVRRSLIMIKSPGNISGVFIYANFNT